MNFDVKGWGRRDFFSGRLKNEWEVISFGGGGQPPDSSPVSRPREEKKKTGQSKTHTGIYDMITIAGRQAGRQHLPPPFSPGLPFLRFLTRRRRRPASSLVLVAGEGKYSQAREGTTNFPSLPFAGVDFHLLLGRVLEYRKGTAGNQSPGKMPDEKQPDYSTGCNK